MDVLKSLGELTLVIVVLSIPFFFISDWLKQKWYEDKNKELRRVAEKYYGLVLGLLILIVIGFFFIKYNFGVSRPGAFFEKGNYDTEAYVLVFPDDGSSKNYYLPADVARDSADNVYNVFTINWPNGGTTDLSDCNVLLEVKTSCTANDDNSTSYSIQLTSNLAK